MPDFSLENKIEGLVCGIDEVGRGPLAGPVVAAAVIIPDEIKTRPFIAEINDSKKLSSKKRENLHTLITEHCHCGIAVIEKDIIDQINILGATMQAMQKAFENLPVKPQNALIDGNKAPELLCPTTTVIKGDSVSTSIAAASIIAKVTRDKIMADLAREYPGYGWDSNSGYGSKQHIEAIHEIGITPHHRRSFEPVKSLINSLSESSTNI